MLIVRKGSIDDLVSIQTLNNQLFKYEVSWHNTLRGEWTFEQSGIEYIKSRLSQTIGVLFVVEFNHKVIAYLSAGNPYYLPFRTERLHVELENMYVEEKYRRLGVGKLLVIEFEKWCKEKNVEVVSVEAVLQNELGLNFYEKNGFSKYNIRLEKQLVGK